MLGALFGRLFTGGEESLLRECARILHIDKEANTALNVSAGARLDLGAIRRLEQLADDEKFRIGNMIASGAIAPNVLDNMLSLLAREDDIVNAIYNLARESSRYGIRDGEEDRYLYEQMAAVSGLVGAALDTLLRMFAQDDLTALRRLRQAIERLEEEGDAIKEAMLDRAYAAPATFQSFYHMVQVAHLADNILDGCEDSADALLTIVSSIIT
jgi:uncharacterized protein Yka (UPF0111/DUF47 family)